MEKHYLIKESTLGNIAEKVRTLRGGASPLTPQRMAEEIEAGADDLAETKETLEERTAELEETRTARDEANASLKAAIEGVGRINTAIPTSIAARKFYSNISLVDISMPEVTSVGDSAFYSCASLSKVNLPKAASIGEYAFYACEKMPSANFPEATSIGERAFYNCVELKTATMPKVTSIAENAFYNCTSLEGANFPEVTSVGDDVFYKCTSLASANLPKATNIGSSAFYGCSELKEIDLDAVESIYSSAFSGCSLLDTIILRSPSIVSLTTSTAFTDTPIANGTGYVYVPSALIAEYEADTYWSAYNFRAIEDYPEIMGYKWEKRGGAITYSLSWDGGTSTSSGSSSSGVTVYSSYTFDESTGELAVAGGSASVTLSNLSGTKYRLYSGVVQKYKSKTYSNSRYTVTWDKPNITKHIADGADVLYGYVTSRDPNRYPDNGVAEDGFTYIKIAGGAE